MPWGSQIERGRASVARRVRWLPPQFEARSAIEPVVHDVTAAAADDRTAPSFGRKMAEAVRRQHRLRVMDGVHDPVFTVNTKLEGRRFASSHGIRLPELLAGPVSFDVVDLDVLPDRFVLKPNDGSTSRGVHLVHRVGPDRYRALLDGARECSGADVLDDVRGFVEAGRISSQVIVESLVHDGPEDDPRPPADWRCVCFYGRVGFIMGRAVGFARHPADMGFRFFDREWADLGAVRTDVRLAPDLDPPRHPDALVDAAERLSAAIPRAMVRIDLFDHDVGVVFNEITPLPGGDLVLAPPHDERFGEMWEDAAARLHAELVCSGELALRWGDSEANR